MPGDAQLPFCHSGEKFRMAESGAWGWTLSGVRKAMRFRGKYLDGKA